MRIEEFEYFKKYSIKELKDKICTGFSVGKYIHWDGQWQKIIYKNNIKKIIVIEGIFNNRINSYSIISKARKNDMLTDVSFNTFLSEFNECKKQNIYTNINVNIYKKLITDSFKSVFPDNEVDIEGYHLELTTYIPSITITNTTGQSHIITDVYVQFCFNLYYKKLESVYLARTSVTSDEVQSGYLFSHIDGGQPGRWCSNFCYGSDNPISILNKALKDNKSISFTEYFLLFREYLNWESLEGKPFNYIGNIGNKSISEVYLSDHIWIEFLPNFINSIKDIIPTLNYHILNVSNNTFKVKLTDDSIDIIDNALTALNTPFNYERYNNISGNLSEINYEFESEVTYKGEKKEVTIVNQPKPSELRIHYCILNRIKNQIENLIETQICNTKINNYVNNR